MEEEKTSTLTEILAARDERTAIQEQLIASYQMPVISFTMNIPGPVKNTPWIDKCFKYGEKDLMSFCSFFKIRLAVEKETAAGPEAFFILKSRISVFEIKKLTTAFEEHHAVGRWFDIDVRDTDGRYISRGQIGAPERKCFLCGRTAKICARSRHHTAQELFTFTSSRIQKYLAERTNDTSDC